MSHECRTVVRGSALVNVEIAAIGHARTLDNERGVASGHNDIDLSEAGVREAEARAVECASWPVNAVFCSDLRRAYRTAEVAFGHRDVPIIRDPRLREADYGALTQRPHHEVVHADHISAPFPGGESYEQVMARMRGFFEDLLARHRGQHVVVIVHRATLYGLEYWANGLSLADAINQWQRRASYAYSLSSLMGSH
jgi:broad specificity phosphatase PhoE